MDDGGGMVDDRGGTVDDRTLEDKNDINDY